MMRATIQPGTIPADSVDRKGGRFKAGILKRYALATRGPALGHGTWLDAYFLEELFAAMTAADQIGIKSRFTHPDMSADGLAKYLGRSHTPELDAPNGKIYGDLHFAKSAHRSPDGDLAGYCLDRSDEDPSSFGASIVFFRDFAAEADFMAAHGATWQEDQDGYRWLDWSTFSSPDPANAENLPHVRLESLEASDLVDCPAANPDGLFHVNPVADFSALMDYAIGQTEQPPETLPAGFDAEPARVRAYFSRYLADRHLTIQGADQVKPTPKEPTSQTPEQQSATPPQPEAQTKPAETPAAPVTKQETPAETPASPPTEQPAAPAMQSAQKMLAEYSAALGSNEAAAAAIGAGQTLTEALTARVKTLTDENAKLSAKAGLATQEEDDPIPATPAKHSTGKPKTISRMAG
jgi:hypothetical protein